MHSNEFLDICVKYFYVQPTTGNRIICRGKNGIKETIEQSNKSVEEFCLDIFLENTEYVFKIFDEQLHEINKISLGLNEKERILRTQGALYYSMYHNKKFIRLLKRKYRQQRYQLSFEVIEWKL